MGWESAFVANAFVLGVAYWKLVATAGTSAYEKLAGQKISQDPKKNDDDAKAEAELAEATAEPVPEEPQADQSEVSKDPEVELSYFGKGLAEIRRFLSSFEETATQV